MRAAYPLFLAGKAEETGQYLDVRDKYTQQRATRVAAADRAAVTRAIEAASAAFETLRHWPSFRRQAVLMQLVERVSARAEEFAQVLAVEVGKSIRDARGEVTRSIDTLRIAAEEATRITGEWLPLDISARAAGYQAIVRRFPLGPGGFITPFNFPLNLVAHKVAPALAVGCPFVLKPASVTPVSALLLGEILAETELPAGSFSILPCKSSDAEPLVTDERIKLLSFTGSAEVGWGLKARAGKKRVSLELGGNAACIVDAGADLTRAAQRITIGAFYQAGQSCISVQRILIHRSIYETLKTQLVARAQQLKAGNPLDEDTFLGPLISEDDARRVEAWVSEAVADRARLLCGGRRDGALYNATYLENVAAEQKVSCQEVFGPVATLEPFDDFEAAVAAANASSFGLQAGVFTNDLAHALYAYEHLDVGGVLINEVPSFRVDSMPYGGVKDSGQGREGIRYAIEEMTERKLLGLYTAQT